MRALAVPINVVLLSGIFAGCSPAAIPSTASIANAAPQYAGPTGVTLSELALPTRPLYLATATDGSAYFGNGAAGTGSPLYLLRAGAFDAFAPAAPPAGETPGGGVYGITLDRKNMPFWLSAYFGSALLPDVLVECGQVPALCAPRVESADTLISDTDGVLWIGGAGEDGHIATSSGARVTFSGSPVLQLIQARGSIWALLRSRTQFSLVQLGLSGCTIAAGTRIDFPLSDSAGSVTATDDGSFWFTDYARQALGQIDPSNQFHEFPAPHRVTPATYGQIQIAADCDGGIWFTEGPDNRVARRTVSGMMTDYAAPSPGAFPAALASGDNHFCAARTMLAGEGTRNALLSITY